ncbi:MAG TPA: FtsX-like permease family protein [Burkholderiales bacterium]|nr:FtsX-like permease family protein [Burkholderiales bacterium]
MARLVLRMLFRDWRAGELRVLTLALVLAAGSVTSVAFFADRVRQALTREAHQVLGADVLLSADHPWSSEFPDTIARLGLRHAESVTFVSMARAGGEAQIASVKAVTPGYPLRGTLRAAPDLNAPDAAVEDIPAAGTVWLDERMMSALKAKPGDPLELGRARFRIAAVLTLEPDRGVSFVNFAPRILMRRDDLPATGLLQPQSRIGYQLLAAGERDAILRFEQWARSRLARGERVDSLENARPEVRAGLDRAQSFLGLAAMLSVILSAVALALGARRYTERHLDGYAVMRCLGASQSRLFWLFAIEFLLLALVASLAGCVLGFLVQSVVAWWLASLIPGTLPQPGPVPMFQGATTAIVLLSCFAFPPLLQLKNVPALRVIRRDVGAARRGAVAVYVIGLAAAFALLRWQAGELRLAAYVFGGFLASFAIFAAVAYAVLRAVAKLGRAGGGVSWRYGLASLMRRPRSNAVQVVAVAVGLTAVLLLTLIRADLLDAWKRRLPPDAPDRFLVNIQPDQRDALADFFERNRLPRPHAFPMVRGRLISIDGRPVSTEDYSDERAKRQVEREFNLSYFSALPADNRVVEGAWFSAKDIASGAISVERRVAERLGIRLGDSLEFLAAGRSFSAPVTSVRKLDWDSMRPNFFFIATPGLLEDFPASYVVSFHAPAGDARLTLRLSQAFPNLTVIDVGTVLRQVQAVMNQLIAAVQLVFLFALAAGILVLYAALLATQDERTHEAAVMRALGASRAQVLAAQRAEFAVLGTIAGALAACGATAIGWALATRIFELDFVWNGWIWVAGPALGLACVVLNAWAGARAALGRPPLAALREAA